MPRTKRDKDVSLTKVTKRKGKDLKQKLVDEIRSCVDQYEHLFVFSVDNMRNNKIKMLRTDWRDNSRFFFGKTKVMAVALGRLPGEEHRENLHRVSKRLVGQCGLLFSNKPKDEVISYFRAYSEPDYARSGNDATETVQLPAGPLEQFQHTMEPQLRKLGMPTSLDKGIVTLTQDFTVCNEGQTLTPEQAKILKLLGMYTVEFHVKLRCVWSRGGKFKSLDRNPKQGRVGRAGPNIAKVPSDGRKRLRQAANVLTNQEPMDVVAAADAS